MAKEWQLQRRHQQQQVAALEVKSFIIIIICDQEEILRFCMSILWEEEDMYGVFVFPMA